MVLGVGADITEVKRMRLAVKRWGKSFLRRIFTEEELKNAKTRPSLYLHLAGRFAAKEAVFKAFGDTGLGWKDIEVLNDKVGKPYCKILNGKGKNKSVMLSISHVKNYAIANAIITKKSRFS